jgi:LysM domain
MSDFVSDFMEQFGPAASPHLSANLGLKQSAANQIIPQVIPMILVGLKRQMQTWGGAERLGAIAQRFYGKASLYPKIFDANRDILTNPDLIKVGQKLKIPKI